MSMYLDEDYQEDYEDDFPPYPIDEEHTLNDYLIDFNEQLQQIPKLEGIDTESAHIYADIILFELLKVVARELNVTQGLLLLKLLTTYKQIPKHY